MLFGMGKLILGDVQSALIFFAVAAVAVVILYKHISSMGWGALRS
jgi:hypothetical protein